MTPKNYGKSQKEIEIPSQKKWVRVYFDDGMKTHSVPEEYLGELVRDLFHRYDAYPSYQEEKDVLYLDPGGMSLLNVEYINFAVNGYKFSIKPEHINHIHSIWTSGKERAGMVKVYGYYGCFFLPKDLHLKVAAKIIKLKPLGDMAYSELFNLVCKEVGVRILEKKDT